MTQQEQTEAEAKRQYEHQLRTQLTDKQRVGLVHHLEGIFCLRCGVLFTKTMTICYCARTTTKRGALLNLDRRRK